MHLEYLEITPGSQQPLCFFVVPYFLPAAFRGAFISLITKLVLDLMREICPFICAFFPSSYLKKKNRISLTKALHISSLLLKM